MRTLIFTVAFIISSPKFSPAQNPVSAYQWISTGRVSALIDAQGALVSDFRIPDNSNDTSTISAIGEISVWMGGFDPAGFLNLAIQRPDTAMSDFRGGFRNISGSARVWKVHRNDIEQHIVDFEDDGDIDVINPAIYAWPGYQNAFSPQYNGFPLSGDDTRYISAPFKDLNSDGIYQPDQGEYPFLGNIINNIERYPTELVYTPFHSKPDPADYAMDMNCGALFFAYDCDDANFLEDAIFGYLNIHYTGQWRKDSFFLAFFIDGNIGDPSNDYMGSEPGNGLVYFYNSDTLQEAGFNGHPPVIAFDSYGNLLDTTGLSTGVNGVMPIYSHNDTPNPLAAVIDPQTPAEYYNYLTGTWRDGTPLSEGGNGYQSGSQFVSFPFTGKPGSSGDWSELSAGNAPGNRRALIFSGPVSLKPGAVNGILFNLDHVSGNSISAQTDKLIQYSYYQADFLYADYFPPEPSPFDTITCLNTTTTFFPEAAEGLIFPNPASTRVTVRSEGSAVRYIEILDFFGNIIIRQQNESNGNEITLSVVGLPEGLYLMRWETHNGGRGIGKLLVVK